MKKFFFPLAGICLLTLAGIYIFIPNQLVIRKVVYIVTSERIVSENFDIHKNRIKWWPAKMAKQTNKPLSSNFTYKKYIYKFKKSGYNFTEINLSKDNLSLNSYVTRNAINKTIELAWQTNVTTSYNPVTRVCEYLEAKKIKQNMDDILESFAKYITKEKNVYGIPIKIITVKDTLLLTTKRLARTYPKTSEIYGLLKDLREYAQLKGAKETDFPMLNINRSYQGEYETMVAMPINKIIQTEPGDNIFINRMVAGNILVTEVKGGRNTIDNALIQLNNYIKDFKLISPAKPFEMLVTDRSKEPDSSKWVTRLYYPIF